MINWFPGHMNKARNDVAKALPKMDILIEVLDARIPYSSENPMIAQLRKDKQTIKVLTKTDLADPARTKQWQLYLEQERGVKTLAITTKDNDLVRTLIPLCHKMAPEKSRSVHHIDVMIVGIPNVGKSTLINILAKRKAAKTGNEPAVTKGPQMIKLDMDLMLHDTPGMLWPKLENQNGAYRLAVTGAIKDTAIDSTDIADFAAEFLKDHYPELLKKYYDLDEVPEYSSEILDIIARKRGCVKAGGKIDYDRVSRIILTEIRSGKMGGMTFETPDMMNKEIEAITFDQQEKMAKEMIRKAERKKRWKSNRK